MHKTANADFFIVQGLDDHNKVPESGRVGLTNYVVNVLKSVEFLEVMLQSPDSNHKPQQDKFSGILYDPGGWGCFMNNISLNMSGFPVFMAEMDLKFYSIDLRLKS